MERIRVLQIEDSPTDARLIKEMLAEDQGVFFDLEWTDTVAKGVKRLAAGGIQVVLLDLNLPDSRGFNTFLSAQAAAPDLPIVIMTGVDDETLAIRAVRKGAQDYLVKGHVDSRQLTRAILYAMARRAGEDRRFTPSQLRENDGKDDRPAYVAVEGKVYDVSGSRMWKDGVHSAQHSAGGDLSEAMRQSPHGEAVLARFHRVGELVREEGLAEKLWLRIGGSHLHPISVHFSIAYSAIISLFAILYLLTDRTTFETTAYYFLLLGCLTSPVAAVSGLISWRVTYQGKMTRAFIIKLICSGVLMAVLAGALALRLAAPDILLQRTAAGYLYLALLLALVPTTTALGYYGGKIVYA